MHTNSRVWLCFDKAKILRMLGENFVLDEHNDIQTQYRMPFNFIAEAKEQELRLETSAVPTELLHNKPLDLKSSRDLIWGTLIDYIYNYFSVNIIYWEVLLLRQERVMRNGTIGPSYNFMAMACGC